MSDQIKEMSVKEFREKGFLQEINRLLLHPLGLALETMADEDGTEIFSRIWDYREDPEGILFTEEIIESEEAKTKARYIKDLFKEKTQTRFLTGLCDKSGIQRVPGVDDEDLSG